MITFSHMGVQAAAAIPVGAGTAIALLLGLALLGNLPEVSSWLPTRLAQGAAMLVAHKAAGVWRPILTTSAASFALVGVALTRINRREP